MLPLPGGRCAGRIYMQDGQGEYFCCVWTCPCVYHEFRCCSSISRGGGTHLQQQVGFIWYSPGAIHSKYGDKLIFPHVAGLTWASPNFRHTGWEWALGATTCVYPSHATWVSPHLYHVDSACRLLWRDQQGMYVVSSNSSTFF
jgi:hypothetical protein